MDHLLAELVLLLWSSGLQADGIQTSAVPGAQCETTDQADIVLLVDGSASISSKDFEIIKLFISDIVSAFNISPDRVQIGLTQFSRKPQSEWHLKTHQTKQSLLKATDKLQQLRRVTNTGAALEHVLRKDFKPNVGMRSDSRKILILITDGKSADNVTDPSQNLRDTGIEIYTVGVRNADERELLTIASDPKNIHVYLGLEFQFLMDIINNLIINVCNSTKSLGSVRLVNGTGSCSGRLEVKLNQSDQWSSVCEADFDQQDAEVVCRELGCESPSVLRGGLYGEVEAPLWTQEFWCGGNESALLDCRTSNSTCSSDRAVGLTCSEPVQLVGQPSRCAGTLEVKHLRSWRPVNTDADWTLKETDDVCRELDCGSAVSIEMTRYLSVRPVWWVCSDCVQSGYGLRECVSSHSSASALRITCSDLLVRPIISSVDAAEQHPGFPTVLEGSSFTISCSIQPQYPGGSFQLILTSSNTSHDYTQPAVNHSADFLFPAAEPAHQGNYICVYHVYVFSHNFSSESRPLSLTVADLTVFIIRAVVLLLSLLLFITAICSVQKTTTGQKPGPQAEADLDYSITGVCGAEEEELQTSE